MDSAFAASIRNIPILGKDEELSLWQKYFDEQTPETRRDQIRDKIIAAHLKLALSIAYKWQRSGVPISDLFGAAQEGLFKAYEKFSLESGNRFSTYALWWIKAAVQEHVLANVGATKFGTTAFKKYLFFNYRRIAADIRSRHPYISEDVLDNVIARKLIKDDKSPYDLPTTLQNMAEYKSGSARAASLDVPLSDENGSGSWVDFLEDDSQVPHIDSMIEDQEMKMGREFLAAAQEEFEKRGKDREWDILASRRLKENPLTLEDLSEIYGVSRERIRQIEVKAFERLQQLATTPGFARLSAAVSEARKALPEEKKARGRPKKEQAKEKHGPAIPVIKLPPELKAEVDGKAQNIHVKPARPPEKAKTTNIPANISIRLIERMDKDGVIPSIDTATDIPTCYNELLSSLHESGNVYCMEFGGRQKLIAIGQSNLDERDITIDPIDTVTTKQEQFIGTPGTFLSIATTAHAGLSMGVNGQRVYLLNAEYLEDRLSAEIQPTKTVKRSVPKVKKRTPVDISAFTQATTPDRTVSPANKTGGDPIPENLEPFEYSFEPLSGVAYRPWKLVIDGKSYHLRKAEKNVLEAVLNAPNPVSRAKLQEDITSFSPPLAKALIDKGLLTRYKKGNDGRTIYYSVTSKPVASIFHAEDNHSLPEGDKDPEVQKPQLTQAKEPNDSLTTISPEEDTIIDLPEVDFEYSFEPLSGVAYRPWKLVLNGQSYHLKQSEKSVLEAVLASARPISRAKLKTGVASFTPPLIADMIKRGLITRYKKSGDGKTVYYSIPARPAPAIFKRQDNNELPKPDIDPEPEAQRIQPAFERNRNPLNQREVPTDELEYSFELSYDLPHKPWTLSLNGSRYHLKDAERDIVEHLLEADDPRSKQEIIEAGQTFIPPVIADLYERGLLVKFKKEGVKRVVYYSVASKPFSSAFTYSDRKQGLVRSKGYAASVKIISPPKETGNDLKTTDIDDSTQLSIANNIGTDGVVSYQECGETPSSYNALFAEVSEHDVAYGLEKGRTAMLIVSAHKLDELGINIPTKGLLTATEYQFLTTPDLYLSLASSNTVGMKLSGEAGDTYILKDGYLEKAAATPQKPADKLSFAYSEATSRTDQGRRPVQRNLTSTTDVKVTAVSSSTTTLDPKPTQQTDPIESGEPPLPKEDVPSIPSSIPPADAQKVEINAADITKHWEQAIQCAKNERVILNVLNRSGHTVGTLEPIPDGSSDIQPTDCIYQTDTAQDFESTLGMAHGIVMLKHLSTEDAAIFVPK